MDTPLTPPEVQPPTGGRFSLGSFFKNRKIVLTLILIVLLAGYGVWAHYGFSLEFFRFFAFCDDCEQTHFECQSNTCTEVDGPGSNECNTDAQCATPEPTAEETPPQETQPPAEETPAGEETPAPVGDQGDGATPTPVAAHLGCQPQNIRRLDTPSITISGGRATARLRNDSDDTCKLSIASYKIWSDRGGTPPHYIAQQTLFNSQTVNVSPGGTVTLSTTVPDCYSQVDIIVDIDPLDPPLYSSGYFLGVDFDNDLAYCNIPKTTATPTPTSTITPTPTPTQTSTPTPTPTATSTPTTTPTASVIPLACAPVTQTVAIEQPAFVQVSGGTGGYTWTAPGASLLTQTHSTATTARYPQAGTYTIYVTDLARNSASCTVIVSQSATPTPTTTITTTVTATPTPTPVPLVCSPSTQTRYPGQTATISAAGGTGTYAWTAPNGTPTSGNGSTFGTSYTTAGGYTVTVTSAGQQATCTVTVVQQPAGLTCSPANQTAFVNQTINFTATGGTSTYAWTAPNAAFNTGSGANFNTRYGSPGAYTVTVTSGTESKTCAVTINQEQTPTPTPLAPGLNMNKLVRNVTTSSGEVDIVPASPGDTVEFIIRATSVGNTTVRNARLADALPQGLSYVAGSTTVDGVGVSDGITSGNILLGDIVPGRTIVVRFRALVAAETTFTVGTTTLTNTATITADNVPPYSDPAFVNVTRNAAAPEISLQKFGRNITRGEFSEQSQVTAYPTNTLEFVIHVRGLSATPIQSIILTDTLPSYITYISNTTSVDGQSRGDGIVGGGIDIGPINPGQEKVIRFSGRVASSAAIPLGTTSVINTVRTNNPPMVAQLPIVIINGSVAGAGTVPTGAQDSVFTALLVSLVITLMYVTYTRTQLFKTREVKSIIKHNRGGEDTFDFKK